MHSQEGEPGDEASVLTGMQLTPLAASFIQWDLSNLDTQAESVLINGCPDFRGYNVQKHDIWGSEAGLFIEVSSLQGVLIRGVPLYIL